MNPYVIDPRDYNMLRAIDGGHKSRIEFEEKARLRTLCRFNIVVRINEFGIVRVDWTTVNQGPML